MAESPFSAQAEFYEHTFSGLVCEGQVVEGAAFFDCIFQECSFSETAFKTCRFNNCHFKDCNLALIQVGGSVFAGVKFEGCQVIGVNWALADLPARRLIKPFDFLNCVINYSVFMGLDLKDIEMTRCIATGTDFSDANLSGANCQYTDFRESRFVQTDLSEADFCHAYNYHIDAAINTLKKTRFMLPEALSLLHSLNIELVE